MIRPFDAPRPQQLDMEIKYHDFYADADGGSLGAIQ